MKMRSIEHIIVEFVVRRKGLCHVPKKSVLNCPKLLSSENFGTKIMGENYDMWTRKLHSKFTFSVMIFQVQYIRVPKVAGSASRRLTNGSLKCFSHIAKNFHLEKKNNDRRQFRVSYIRRG